ncbi:hypothetical protein [Flavobacterium algicola]|uniref:hypothetical protein n=1 Tax=Flavobacterium algicola TaxID=556529 RepID=UPI001EFE1FA0|nr:hypothetical protein [Flavobacterium algicola]MCG9792480.1 hypothetical protein [Flavobacterium algicola]
MSYDQMYKLTPRSFFNAVNGFRKKEDRDSKERFILTRKILFATMKPHYQGNLEEYEVWPFPWEENTIKELTESQRIEAIEKAEESKAFWEEQDRKKLAKTSEQ